MVVFIRLMIGVHLQSCDGVNTICAIQGVATGAMWASFWVAREPTWPKLSDPYSLSPPETNGKGADQDGDRRCTKGFWKGARQKY